MRLIILLVLISTIAAYKTGYEYETDDLKSKIVNLTSEQIVVNEWICNDINGSQHCSAVSYTKMPIIQQQVVMKEITLEEHAGVADCFPRDMLIETCGGRYMKMEEIGIGYNIKTSSGCERIINWFHKDPLCVSEYLKITTDTKTLKISSNHFIPTDIGTILAKELKIGMKLYLHNKTEMIQNITTSIEIGKYAPYVRSGDIYVNGILVSVYANILPPVGTEHLLFKMMSRYSFDLCNRNGYHCWVYDMMTVLDLF